MEASTVDRRDAELYVTQAVRGSGSSFYWGMRKLPLQRRITMYAVYAFCRAVDDIADGDSPVEDKLRQLAEWRGEVEDLFSGAPHHPITVLLHESAVGLSGPTFRKADFLAVIDGMEMDARTRVRIRDDAELSLYCDRVACAVGRLSNCVFGAECGFGDAVAKALGEALQLTNILRDIEEDAMRDRLYLPFERLRACGIDVDDMPSVLASPKTGGVCADLAEIASRRFAEAHTLLASGDRRAMRPAVMMMGAYERVFAKLKARGWDRFRERVSLTKPEKLWIAFRYGILPP